MVQPKPDQPDGPFATALVLRLLFPIHFYYEKLKLLDFKLAMFPHIKASLRIKAVFLELLLSGKLVYVCVCVCVRAYVPHMIG